MKDYLKQLLENQPNNLLKRSVTREYLQARILQVLQENGAFLNWAFLGGTALRFLYSVPRYSEDLDFSVTGSSQELCLRDLLKKIMTGFEAENYTIAVKANESKAVVSALVCFEGLLYALGVSPHRTEVLTIRLEVDTNPPAGAGTETTIVRRYVTLNLLHYDKPSMLAGKLHALLSRKYTKGRDLYDLVWYLADRTWPAPNFTLLNNALRQSDWQGPTIIAENWRDVLLSHLKGIHWKQAVNDIRPFLEREGDASLLTKQNCMKLVCQKT